MSFRSSPSLIFVFVKVLPIFGMLLTLSCALSPALQVAKARRLGTLGPINPYPWVFYWITSVLWIGYGLIIGNVRKCW